MDPGRAGRAKIKKASMKRSCGVQDLSNEPLPIALPALLAEQLRKLPSLLYDDLTLGLVPWVNLSPFGQTLAQNWASETIQSELRV